MPWPDFSELSFGVAFLREYEAKHCMGSVFPTAPEFISQNEEAQKGYDVEVTNGSIPVFLQFKRSFVLSSARAKEVQAGHFSSPPIFRMNLHKKNGYAQHTSLQSLESSGQTVFYVTSQVATKLEFNKAFRDGNIFENATAMFSPNEIVLPDTSEAHHVTFRADADWAYVYSDSGERFERKFPSPGTVVETMVLRGLNDREGNLRALDEVSSSLAQRNRAAGRFTSNIKDPAIRASVLAFLVLDAHLTFFRPMD